MYLPVINKHTFNNYTAKNFSWMIDEALVWLKIKKRFNFGFNVRSEKITARKNFNLFLNSTELQFWLYEIFYFCYLFVSLENLGKQGFVSENDDNTTVLPLITTVCQTRGQKIRCGSWTNQPPFSASYFSFFFRLPFLD